jgi:DNA-binding LacI/PurR family transcriptional regulator
VARRNGWPDPGWILRAFRTIGKANARHPQYWNYHLPNIASRFHKLAATRLIEAGARSPYLVDYTERDSRHTLRKLGFQTKWVESGRSLDDITEHWINPSNTYLRVVKLERKARSMQDCDSVFCLEKESAIDLLNILEHRNIKVPDSIKVLGVDGTFDGLKNKPTLTYVKQMFRDMASTAAEKMCLLCSSTDTKRTGTSTEKVLVAPQLVVRQSA